MTAINTTIITQGLHSAPVWVVGQKYSARVRIITQKQNNVNDVLFGIGGIPQLERFKLEVSRDYAGVVFDAVINFEASQIYPSYSCSDFGTILEVTTLGPTTDPISIVCGGNGQAPPVPIQMPNFIFSVSLAKTTDIGDDFEISYTSNPDKYLFGVSVRGAISPVQYISEFKGTSPVLAEISRVTSPWYVAVFTPSSTLIRKKFFQLQSSSSSLFLRS